jgi:hypothetical protein
MLAYDSKVLRAFAARRYREAKYAVIWMTIAGFMGGLAASLIATFARLAEDGRPVFMLIAVAGGCALGYTLGSESSPASPGSSCLTCSRP